jgi:hypothetical protein
MHTITLSGNVDTGLALQMYEWTFRSVFFLGRSHVLQMQACAYLNVFFCPLMSLCTTVFCNLAAGKGAAPYVQEDPPLA